MRPKHPHAAESGVGKHTARESERAQSCAIGKECVANTQPQIWPRDRKVPGPYFFGSLKRRRKVRRSPVGTTHGEPPKGRAKRSYGAASRSGIEVGRVILNPPFRSNTIEPAG